MILKPGTILEVFAPYGSIFCYDSLHEIITVNNKKKLIFLKDENTRLKFLLDGKIVYFSFEYCFKLLYKNKIIYFEKEWFAIEV